MAEQSPKPEDLAAMAEFGNEFFRYMDLFRDAFDELHGLIVKEAKSPAAYIEPHSDYPVRSSLDNGFPSFRQAGLFESNSPRNYLGIVRPSLGKIFGGAAVPRYDLPKRDELASFLRNHKIGKRLDLARFVHKDIPMDWPVKSLVEDAVERYLHLYGLDVPINTKRRDNIIQSLVLGTIRYKLELRLVVPIALTHFDVDRFRLNETAYIVRMSDRLQLARARMSTLGSGAVRMVVGAATHAFVANGWSLDADTTHEVDSSLRHVSSNALEAIDSFFGAIRIATGINTGYAQVLWIPRGSALNYYCDLTPVYGSTLRKYPSEHDNFGWTGPGAQVTAADLAEVRRIYRAVVGSQSEAIRLALHRLNGCLTRTDVADAILDGTIGLELLLGDDQNQSLSYKLRLRAAALAILRNDPAFPVDAVASKVKRLYEARSAIVHGRSKKRSKKASESTDTSNAEERMAASDLLRFVLSTLLMHPEYQVPTKIDEGLLLRRDEMKVGALQ
jgi:hypothetical protein